jgi:hypothetical protein
LRILVPFAGPLRNASAACSSTSKPRSASCMAAGKTVPAYFQTVSKAVDLSHEAFASRRKANECLTLNFQNGFCYASLLVGKGFSSCRMLFSTGPATANPYQRKLP